MKLFATSTEIFAQSSFAEKDLCKALGLWWNPAGKRWAVAMDRLPRLLPAQLARLAEYAADDATRALLGGRSEERKASMEASRAVDAALEIPAPAGLSYLPFQKAGVAFAANRPAVLIADEMGLGKTIQALGLVNMDTSIRTVMVVCPASLKLNWAVEAAKWLVAGCTVSIEEAKGTQKVLTTGAGTIRVHIANYEALRGRSDLQALHVDLLVVDEAHYCKNQKTQRTQAVAAVAKNARRKALLTGTPIVNRPVELFTLLAMLDPVRYGEKAFFAFAKRYCDAKQVYAGRNGYVWDFTGASNLDELQDQLRSTLMVRRLKADVLKELPAKRRQVVLLPNTRKLDRKTAQTMATLEAAKAAVEAAQILGDAAAYADAVDALNKAMTFGFEELSAERHAATLAKVPAALAHIENALEDNTNKIVVFAHHADVIAALAEGLSAYGVVTVTGQTPVETRQANVVRFQNDATCRVFVGNMQAAGVGLTLTASSHVVFVELDWVPGTVSQAEDRCHRIGQKDSVLVQQLVVDGSIDVMFAEALVEKQKVIDQAMDAQHSETASEAAIKAAEQKAAAMQAEAIAKAAAQKAFPAMPEAQKVAILQGLRVLAANCDGTLSKDGTGFNRLHTSFGKKLAACPSLTDRQAAAARVILGTYRNTQLPAALVAQIWSQA